MAFTKPDEAVVTEFSQKAYADSAAAQDLTAFPGYYRVTVAGSTSESEYQNTGWGTQLGAYLEISELAGMIDRKAQYVVGKGYKINKTFKGKTKKSLDHIRGNGLDSFNSIMYNGVRVYTIGGDFFAEIIKNKRADLKNLKPWNPGAVKVKANDKGIIQKYVLFPELGETGKSTAQTFDADEVFHLAYNRIGDQIHGQSVMDKLKEIIEMRREAMKDIRVVFHRYVKPIIISSVDTDDPDEIKAYKKKLDNAIALGENMVVPKGVLDGMDRMSIPKGSTLDPLPWIKLLQSEFFKAEGIPNLIVGRSSGASEAEAKILYLAWQQVVEYNQMFIEEQIKSQLGLDIKFEFPASIAPDLINNNTNPGNDADKMNTFGTKPDEKK